MRILMLTQWFDPEPTFKGLPFAKELVRLGHDVEVLTGFPNYPGGKVYDGYSIRALQRETLDGIPIMRVPLYPSHDLSALRRIANYCSFSLSAALMGAFFLKPADVMYIYHPPATVGFPGIVLNLLRKIPFVYDIQDLWPDSLSATGMLKSKRLLRLIDWWCCCVYLRAARIAVLSPGFRQILIQRGVPQEKIEVIYNWCDELQVCAGGKNERLSDEVGLSGKFNVVFAGTMGKGQALNAAIDAAALLSGRLPDVQLVFVGGGIEVEQLKTRVEKKRLLNVRFLPRRPVSEIGGILQLADVLLVHLKDDPLFSITVPSKTQAYMAAGKPILMAVRGDAAELVEKAGAGIVCAPECPDSIAKGVERFYAMPATERDCLGENGKKFYERELSLRIGVKKFEGIFTSVVRQHKKRVIFDKACI